MNVRKIFLRALACIMAVCMLAMSGVGFTVGVVNENNKAIVFNYEGAEVVVSGFNDKQTAQLIANATINGETATFPNHGFATISPSSLCFFHQMVTAGTSFLITHRVWETAPRCREQTYRIHQCIRCSHLTLTQISDSRIRCCA